MKCLQETETSLAADDTAVRICGNVTLQFCTSQEKTDLVHNLTPNPEPCKNLVAKVGVRCQMVQYAP